MAEKRVKSYIENLSDSLNSIEADLVDFVSGLKLKEFHNDPDSSFAIISPPYYYSAEISAAQKYKQLKVKEKFSEWVTHLLILFRDAPDLISSEIDSPVKDIQSWIEIKKDWGIDEEAGKNLNQIKGNFALLRKVLSIHHSGNPVNIIVPDTNSLIFSPEFSHYRDILHIDSPTIVLLPTVLSELDKLKVTHKEAALRDKVKALIKRIKGLRSQGDLLSGVTYDRNIRIIAMAKEPDFSKTLDWLDEKNNDDRIIASILEVQRTHPEDITILVSADINLQNKASITMIPYLEPPNQKE